MADISRLSRMVNGVLRGVDISTNTLVMTSLKLDTTELTKAILDKLLLVSSQADADGSFDLQYLGISATAADSSKLNGQSASYYALASHNHDLAYLGISATAADSAMLNGQSASYYALASHNHDLAYLGISATAADSAKLNGQSASYYEVADATILKEADVVDALNSTSTTAPLSANQGKQLNDSKLALAGGTMSGAIAMGSQKITGLADGTTSNDAVNLSQLNAALGGIVFKETLLKYDQLFNDAGGNTGGIAAANVIVLSANLEAGDSITLNDGSSTETYVADTDFSVGVSINATLANLEAAIDGGAIAVSAVALGLLSIDPTNNVLVMWADTVANSSTRVYGNAAAAIRVKILPVSKLYTGVAADLVALPTTDPAVTNFGFNRVQAGLVVNETHYCRDCDAQWTWNNDTETWNLTGSSSVPLATKSTSGKVQVGDGIAVAGGVISAAVDNSSLELSGSSPNKVIQVKASGITANMLAGSIGYAKLSLSNSIVNADIASGAGILESKLTLDYSTSSLNSAIGGKEPTITAGISSQYWRGDKSWQTLNTAAVAEDPSYLYFTASRAKTAAVVNTLAGSETDQAPSVSAVNTALGGKEPTLSAGTSSQYYRGDKTWQTLDTAAVAEHASYKYFTDGRAQTAAVENAINSGTTNKAPSEDAVFTALAAKAPNSHEHSRIQKTMVAGETFTADTTYAVRMAMTGETAGRIYKADFDASSSDKFYVIGVVQVAVTASAGDSVVVTMLGEISLGASDVAFAAGEIGQAVHLKTAGAWDAVSQITYAANQASVRFAIVQETGKMLVCAIQVNGVN